MITDMDQAFSYISRHYWDHFLSESRTYPKDTTLFAGIDYSDFEEAFAEYATFLLSLSPEDITLSQNRLFSLVERAELRDTSIHFFDIFNERVEHYFNHPNSPYRSEEVYLAWQTAILNSSVASDEEKTIAKGEIPLLSQNRLGTKAANFRFTTNRGDKKELYDIKSDYILLLISNIGCNACKEVTDFIQSSEVISTLVSNNILTILNIYPDTDYSTWKNYIPDYPSSWINGWDELDEFESKYYLKAIPSIYLFGKDFTVIEKDAPLERILNYFDENIGKF